MFRINFKTLFVLTLGALLAVDPQAAALYARAEPSRKKEDEDGITVADQFRMLENPFPRVNLPKSINDDKVVAEILKLKKEADYFIRLGRQTDPAKTLIRYSKKSIAALKKAHELNPKDETLIRSISRAKNFCGSHYITLSMEQGTILEKKKWLHKSEKYLTTLMFDHSPNAIRKIEHRAAVFGLWGIEYYESAKVADSPKGGELYQLAIKDLELSVKDYNEMLQYKNTSELIISKATTNYYLAISHYKFATLETDPVKISENHLEVIQHLNTTVSELIKTLEAYASVVAMQDDRKVVAYVAFSHYFLGVIYEIFARSDVAQQTRYFALSKQHFQKAYSEFDKAEKLPYIPQMLLDMKVKKEHCKNYFDSRDLTFNYVGLAVSIGLAVAFGGMKTYRDFSRDHKHIQPEEKVALPQKNKLVKSKNPISKKKSLTKKANASITSPQEVDTSDSKNEPDSTNDTKNLNGSVSLSDASTKKPSSKSLSKFQRRLTRKARIEHRKQRFADAKTPANPVLTLAVHKESSKPKLPKKPPTQIQQIGSKQLELRRKRQEIQDAILKQQIEEKAEKERAKKEAIQKELDKKNKELEEIRIKEVEEKAKLDAFHKAKKDTEEKIKAERMKKLEQHFDKVAAELKARQESYLKNESKTAVTSTQQTVKYKKQFQRLFVARLKIHKKASTAKIAMQLNLNASHTLIPAQASLSLKDGVVIDQMPDVFNKIASDVCGYQEKSGRKFYLTGGTAREFVVALMNPELPIIIDDLDYLTGAEMKEVATLFDAAGFKPKVHLKDVSEIHSSSGLSVSFRHHPNLKDSEQTKSDLKEDSLQRDTTINALYIEFVKVDHKIKAIIHDPTGKGIEHLLNTPPIVAFYGDKNAKVLADPMHIIRGVYQKVKLQGMISKEDADLINTILIQNPSIFEKCASRIDWWISKKINKLPAEQRKEVYRNLKEMNISQYFPDVIKRKYRTWLKLPQVALHSSSLNSSQFSPSTALASQYPTVGPALNKK